MVSSATESRFRRLRRGTTAIYVKLVILDDGGRGGMSDREPPYPASPGRDPPLLDPDQLQALRDVPSGALALSGAAVALLLLAWLAIYFLIYLPRGMVG